MDISKSEAIIVQDGDKLFICVETNEEGIADFRRSSKYGDLGVEICTMWVEGEKKPAFRFEVKDPEWYQKYMRSQWKREAAWKMEQRCII